MNQHVVIIGKAEYIDIPELGVSAVPARIDTGAKTSAIWASRIRQHDDGLSFVLFAPQSDLYTGEVVTTKDFGQTVVSSSNGEAEVRYVVRLSVHLAGKKIRASFTLADRSRQVYPVLIGRKTLAGKFLVDVKRGIALTDSERQRSRELKSKLGRRA